MDWETHIISDPRILYGKPSIRGTRIGVDLILEKLSAGQTMLDLLNAYPHLQESQILACLAFAANKIRNEIVLEVVA